MKSGTTPGNSDRFPGFDVLARAPQWDEETAGVVLARLETPQRPRFFTRDEEVVARPLFDRLLGQQDDPKVPVFELVDGRLADGETDGWRYDDMPEDFEAMRRSLAFVDDDCRTRFGVPFGAADRRQQIEVLQAVKDAKEWHDLPAARVWNLWMRYACAAFYSHPWAWNEIGFGGPAYPTGYKNLGVGGREPWEVPERDAEDPEPWARRVERARARHQGER